MSEIIEKINREIEKMKALNTDTKTVDVFCVALTTAEQRLLNAWRKGDTAQLLTMIAGRISEVHGE